MADTTLLTALRLVVLLLGTTITITSFRAYRRTGSRFLGTATAGFAVITFGVFVEGVLFQTTGLTLTQVHIIESVAIGIGFVVLHLSLRQ